jgi:Rieske Fe-S protein
MAWNLLVTLQYTIKTPINSTLGGVMENNHYSRREFISSAAALAVLMPVLGFDVSAMSRSMPVSTGPVTLDLTDNKYKVLAKAGGALKIPNTFDGGKPIIVIRTSETLVAAFSSKCTHWGCELPLPVNNAITCPCHGACFTAEGKVTHGPTKKDLTTFPATLEGSVITIRNVIEK